MNHLLDQLYKTKLQLAGLVTAVIGVALLFLARHVEGVPTLSWLAGWPTKELGSTFLGLGVFGLIFEYYAHKEAEARATENFRNALRQEAPALVDAVLDSFAASPGQLKNIASDETLDRIAANTIGLRVDDTELAAEAYADLREQVIRSPQRWRDVDISVSLSSWKAGPTQGRGSMFVATVR
ncbi:hypothetical protein OHS18_38375 [Amycolatopsis sp. NBC_00355]|uniref:hypothetical protein n=1 Tax=Amycolatopsis sp. NBC_00355 TaxID=2975957 RepID=UPI002E274A32